MGSGKFAVWSQYWSNRAYYAGGYSGSKDRGVCLISGKTVDEYELVKLS